MELSISPGASCADIKSHWLRECEQVLRSVLQVQCTNVSHDHVQVQSYVCSFVLVVILTHRCHEMFTLLLCACCVVLSGVRKEASQENLDKNTCRPSLLVVKENLLREYTGQQEYLRPTSAVRLGPELIEPGHRGERSGLHWRRVAKDVPEESARACTMKLSCTELFSLFFLSFTAHTHGSTERLLWSERA